MNEELYLMVDRNGLEVLYHTLHLVLVSYKIISMVIHHHHKISSMVWMKIFFENHLNKIILKLLLVQK